MKNNLIHQGTSRNIASHTIFLLVFIGYAFVILIRRQLLIYEVMMFTCLSEFQTLIRF